MSQTTGTRLTDYHELSDYYTNNVNFNLLSIKCRKKTDLRLRKNCQRSVSNIGMISLGAIHGSLDGVVRLKHHPTASPKG